MCFCRFHLVLEGLTLEASAGVEQALDHLVVVLQRGEQFLEEYCWLLCLKHLEYYALIAEGSCVEGVGLKQSDGVANDSETMDVTNSLGCHIGGWLVVC